MYRITDLNYDELAKIMVKIESQPIVLENDSKKIIMTPAIGFIITNEIINKNLLATKVESYAEKVLVENNYIEKAQPNIKMQNNSLSRVCLQKKYTNKTLLEQVYNDTNNSYRMISSNICKSITPFLWIIIPYIEYLGRVTADGIFVACYSSILIDTEGAFAEYNEYPKLQDYKRSSDIINFTDPLLYERYSGFDLEIIKHFNPKAPMPFSYEYHTGSIFTAKKKDAGEQESCVVHKGPLYGKYYLQNDKAYCRLCFHTSAVVDHTDLVYVVDTGRGLSDLISNPEYVAVLSSTGYKKIASKIKNVYSNGEYILYGGKMIDYFYEANAINPEHLKVVLITAHEMREY